jgi:hypothetical protein
LFVIGCDEPKDRRLIPANRGPGCRGFTFLGRGLEPAGRPDGGKEPREVRPQFRLCGQHRDRRLDLLSRHQFRERHQLAMDIVKEQFRRNRRGRTGLGRGDLRPDHLHHVIEQHTKRELKHGPLRRRANEPLEMKDFRDLLEHPLDTPAGEVEVEQFGGRDQHGVE